MPQRNFSVIVAPDAWEASLEELARVLAPMTSVRARQLVPVLERGAMTLDADLSREEAERLFDRLASANVPARVVDGDDNVVRALEDSANAEEEKAEAKPEEESRSESGESADDAEFDEAEVDSEDPDEGWDAFLGDVDVEDIDVPSPEASPQSQTDEIVATPSGYERTPTLDELEWGETSRKKAPGSQTMLGAPGPGSGVSTPASRSPQPTPAQADVSPEQPEEPKEPDRASPPETAESVEQLGPDPSTGPSSSSDTPTPSDKSTTPPPQIPSRGVEGEEHSAEKSPEETTKPMGSMSEAGFDASRMNAALDTDSDRPPFEPEGFDDRNEHIPVLAAILSLLAPGAGQTYNGEPEKSWEFGTRFALLVPWYRSVRQAWERAEQIRTYYAPRPKEGALVRAVKYAMSWWIIVGGLVALLGFGGYASYNTLTRPERPKITEADIRSAHDEARRQVMMARIGGLDGVSNYLDERDEQGRRFTMSEEERVERSFRRGYEACRNREFDTCVASMKNVASLSPKYRREAYKLQAWASMQRSPNSADQPMPKVEVGSLEAYETRGSEHEDNQPDPTVDAPVDAGTIQRDGGPSEDARSKSANESEDAP